MSFLSRELICERLRLRRRQSYRIVGSAYGTLVSSKEIVAILNRSRRAIDDPLSYIPSDLATPEEASKLLEESSITSHDLTVWTKRTKNVPPHFRLNKQTVRFSMAMLETWLEDRSRIRRRS